MSNILTRFRDKFAVLAAGALALGVVGTAIPAAADTGNLDADAKGEIVITKYTNPGTGVVGDGTEATKPGADTLDDVTFSYAKVEGIDLTTNDGWAKVDGLKVDANGTVTDKEGKTNYPTGDATEVTTKDGGLASTGEIDLGVYLIKETKAPAKVTTKSAPFLVTVPFPHAEKGWLYKVHVYPKNTVVDNSDLPVKKLVGDGGQVFFPGGVIGWEITQKVPALGANEKLSVYKITDQLPTGVDKPETTGVKVEVTDADGQPVADIKPTVEVTEDKLVTVDFQGEELAKLKTGYTVKVTITTKVATDVNGSIENTSKLTVNDKTYESTPDGNFDPDKPGKPTTKDFAALTIKKQDVEKRPLDDAKFTITPAADTSTADKCVPAGDNSRTVTTKAGKATQQVAVGKYCVVETEAPVGFEIDPAYTEGGKLVDVPTDGFELTVVNKSVGSASGLLPKLPMTGAQGALILTLLGIAVVAVAFGTGMVSVRRKQN